MQILTYLYIILQSDRDREILDIQNDKAPLQSSHNVENYQPEQNDPLGSAVGSAAVASLDCSTASCRRDDTMREQIMEK